MRFYLKFIGSNSLPSSSLKTGPSFSLTRTLRIYPPRQFFPFFPLAARLTDRSHDLKPMVFPPRSPFFFVIPPPLLRFTAPITFISDILNCHFSREIVFDLAFAPPPPFPPQYLPVSADPPEVSLQHSPSSALGPQLAPLSSQFLPTFYLPLVPFRPNTLPVSLHSDQEASSNFLISRATWN